MSKTEYDLKAICMLPMTYPKKLCNTRGDYNIQQPRLPPNNAGRPVRQFKCLLAWLKWRTGSPLVRYCFLVRRGDDSSQALTQGSDHMLTEWGNTPKMLVNNGLRNGVLLDGNNPLSETILWLITEGFLWHSIERDYTRGAHELKPQHMCGYQI